MENSCCSCVAVVHAILKAVVARFVDSRRDAGSADVFLPMTLFNRAKRPHKPRTASNSPPNGNTQSTRVSVGISDSNQA